MRVGILLPNWCVVPTCIKSERGPETLVMRTLLTLIMSLPIECTTGKSQGLFLCSLTVDNCPNLHLQSLIFFSQAKHSFLHTHTEKLPAITIVFSHLIENSLELNVLHKDTTGKPFFLCLPLQFSHVVHRFKLVTF